eukprot:1159555-Pelagomonas_calceolata.AAC.9
MKERTVMHEGKDAQRHHATQSGKDASCINQGKNLPDSKERMLSTLTSCTQERMRHAFVKEKGVPGSKERMLSAPASCIQERICH